LFVYDESFTSGLNRRSSGNVQKGAGSSKFDRL